MAAELPKAYDPHAVEQRWYGEWEARGYFWGDADPKNPKRFCITVPPPNVTAELHMGHAVNHLVHDVLARWHRMQGAVVRVVPGCDHAGIATERQVVKWLAADGITKDAIGREGFIAKCWEWTHKYGGAIHGQWRALGCSYDWRPQPFDNTIKGTRFTMDSGYAVAVNIAFKRLYEDGFIYRGERVGNWCPGCRSILSDLEVRHRDEPNGRLYFIRYPFADGDGAITVATTRPETMLGDIAVAVNPKDERYTKVIGRRVRLPLVTWRDADLPIITDADVDPAFGTGALKVTPVHDATDYEIASRHGLWPYLGDAALVKGGERDTPSVLRIIGRDGAMTEHAGPYAGLDRFDARKRVVADLEAQGLLEKTEPYSVGLGRCDRCDTVIEPLLTTQWYCRMKEMAAAARAPIADGRIKYIPDRYAAQTLDWLDGIRDWPISRQLWWGYRLPIFHCAQGHEWCQIQSDPRCPKCADAAAQGVIEQDPDVLDTWFSSALWPFAVLGWPERTPDLAYFYPTNVLITDRQILFLWVVRMVMMGLHLLTDRAEDARLPFWQVIVHPTIQTIEGRRMSKSLGTGVEPIALAGQYGTDGLRFGVALQSGPAQDVRFDEDKCAEGKHFANKLWNATRFALPHLGDAPPARPGGPLPLHDRWMFSRLRTVCAEVDAALAESRLSSVAQLLYQFVWNEFCDWYVELSKEPLRDPATADATRWTLYTALDTILRLLHPLMPFVTEELWQRLPRAAGAPASVMIADWPQPPADWDDPAAEQAFRDLIAVVAAIRQLREGAAGASKPSALLVGGDGVLSDSVTRYRDPLRRLGQIEDLRWGGETDLAADAPAQEVATAAGVVRVALDLRLSPEERARERARLEKAVIEAQAWLDSLVARLADPKFRDKAPEAVRVKTEGQRAEAAARVASLQRRLEQLNAD